MYVVYEAWARVTPFVAASLPLRMHKHSWKCTFVLIIIAMLIIIIAETDVSSINARQNTTKIVINISHLSQRARNMQKEREKENRTNSQPFRFTLYSDYLQFVSESAQVAARQSLKFGENFPKHKGN